MPAKLIVTVGDPGCLDPLRRVLSELRPDLDASIVVVRPRGATPGGLLRKRLQEVTRLPIVAAENVTPLRSGEVYVLPTEAHVCALTDSRLEVQQLRTQRRHLALSEAVRLGGASFGPDLMALVLTRGAAPPLFPRLTDLELRRPGWPARTLSDVRAADGTVLLQEDPRYPHVPGALPRGTIPLQLSEISYAIERMVSAGALRQLLTGVS